MCLIVAMVILRLEPQRYAGSAKRILRQYAPEVAGVTACLLLAAALRTRGDAAGAYEDNAAWDEITRQWPILLTADTLLSLQTMLRLVILLSVVLRTGAGPVPLASEAAMLWFCATAARLAAVSLNSSYALDGPVGGALPIACEVASLPLLLAMSRGPALSKAPLTTAVVIASTACLATRNHLNLAENDLADTCFAVAHLFDVLAAFTYLLRTLLLDTVRKGDAAVGFTHLLMPVQQSLSTYYYVVAFDAVPSLVGAGLPFELLQIGATAQLGALLGAVAFHLAEGFEGRASGEQAAPRSPRVST